MRLNVVVFLSMALVVPACKSGTTPKGAASREQDPTVLEYKDATFPFPRKMPIRLAGWRGPEDGAKRLVKADLDTYLDHRDSVRLKSAKVEGHTGDRYVVRVETSFKSNDGDEADEVNCVTLERRGDSVFCHSIVVTLRASGKCLSE